VDEAASPISRHSLGNLTFTIVKSVSHDVVLPLWRTGGALSSCKFPGYPPLFSADDPNCHIDAINLSLRSNNHPRRPLPHRTHMKSLSHATGQDRRQQVRRKRSIRRHPRRPVSLGSHRLALQLKPSAHLRRKLVVSSARGPIQSQPGTMLAYRQVPLLSTNRLSRQSRQ
jgi:hypothetical protein